MKIANVNVGKSIAFGLVLWLSFGIVGTAGTLTSVKVTMAPVIDGTPEAIWDGATVMTVNVAGGANSASHTVMLKSVYTDDSVYFLAQWDDATESIRRTPWQKQADGTWMQLKTPNAKEGGENTYYEDKFAQIWNINAAGFDATGCFAVCHAAENSDVKDYGNKYTSDGIADIWHWKLIRNNAADTVDDQYVDNTRYSATAREAGRKSDPGTSSYTDNGLNPVTKMPNFTSPTQPAQTSKAYWILDAQKQPFTDTYKANDEIAGIIVRTPSGDRADIKGKAIYTNGKWTLEYGRKLSTGSNFDVQFSDLKKEYSFGTAVFDNAQTRHSYETGVSKLAFGAAAPTATSPPATSPAPVTTTKAPAFEVLFAISALLVAILKMRR